MRTLAVLFLSGCLGVAGEMDADAGGLVGADAGSAAGGSEPVAGGAGGGSVGGGSQAGGSAEDSGVPVADGGARDGGSARTLSVGAGELGRIAVSDDGWASWSFHHAQTNLGPTDGHEADGVRGLAFGGGVFVLAGSGGPGAYFRSADGRRWDYVDWTRVRPNGQNPGGFFGGVTYVGGRFIIVGGNRTILQSPDGAPQSWVNVPMGTPGGPGQDHFRTIVSDGPHVLICGDNGYYTSSDSGATWAGTVYEAGSLMRCEAPPVFGNGVFATVSGGRVFYLDPAQATGTPARPRWQLAFMLPAGAGWGDPIAFGAGRFLVYSGSTLLASADLRLGAAGVQTLTMSPAPPRPLRTLSFGDGWFMAAGRDPAQWGYDFLARSADGVTWEYRFADGTPWSSPVPAGVQGVPRAQLDAGHALEPGTFPGPGRLVFQIITAQVP